MQQAAGGDRLSADRPTLHETAPACRPFCSWGEPGPPGVLCLSGQRKMHTAGADPGTQSFTWHKEGTVDQDKVLGQRDSV